MPDWTSQGGRNAGKDPKAGRKIALCLCIAFGIFLVLLFTGVLPR